MAGVAFLLALAGCIEAVGFNPRGDDVVLTGQWTVDGAAPTAESCAAQSLRRVRWVFSDGAFEYYFRDFTADCTAGGLGLDTAEANARRGTYMMRWSGLDEDDDEVMRSEPFAVEADLPELEDGSAPVIPVPGVDLQAGAAALTPLPLLRRKAKGLP